ncbi:MAG: substrate-binding domain-containing protein [Anaerolineae bacterium]|nr:substrate-binding domain-containing protein [Anaerolineae bacterium]
MPKQPYSFRKSRRYWLKIRPYLIGVGLLITAVYILWPWLPGTGAKPTRTVIVYGFSILGEVMNEGIFPAFQQEWLAQTGEPIEFISSFAGSGTITNQIVLGVPAEVAILSLELDALRLVDNHVLPGHTWLDLPHDGILNRTPFIIQVRPTNPKNITDFSDLAQPGIGIVHPDPLTSGGAQWAILAEYGSGLRQSSSAEAAKAQLLGIWQNLVAQSPSARGARTQFDNGFGDALITYEQEPLYDQSLGRLNAEIVYPQSTVLSEHIVVVMDDNIPEGDEEVVQAFVDFLWSEPAQRIFIEYGFRSVDEALNASNPNFGDIADPFTVRDLGGWPQAKQEIIESIWKEQVLTEINK